MFRYAQIDENGYVVSDSHLSGEVNYPNMIPVSDDFDLTNKKYVDGEWVEYEPEPVQEFLADDQELLYQTATNTEMILCLMELQ